MRFTILPLAITLTKAHRDVVSMIAKGCSEALVLPLGRFLFFLPNYIQGKVILMQKFSYIDKREVLQNEYSQPLILPSPQFWWEVKRAEFKVSIIIRIL